MPSTAASIAAVNRPRVLADLMRWHSVVLRDAVLVLGAAGLVGALAQISIPHSPVPITGQTLGVLLAGCTLGCRRGFLSMCAYFLLGLAGTPWFVGGTSGWQGASTGYLFGFILAAAVCGFLSERGADRTVRRSVPLMLVGEVCIYVCGVPWLALDLHEGLGAALAQGFSPFVIGDAVKLVGAAALLPSAWWLTDARSR